MCQVPQSEKTKLKYSTPENPETMKKEAGMKKSSQFQTGGFTVAMKETLKK
jgi:hypothetical protein